MKGISSKKIIRKKLNKEADKSLDWDTPKVFPSTIKRIMRATADEDELKKTE